MLEITPDLSIPDSELEWSAIRAQGAGGQNVNKVATAIQLRFDSAASMALSPAVKARLLELADRRVGRDGVIVIKAQRHRTQEQNRRDAGERLRVLLQKAMATQKPRKATRPSRRAREKRLEDKAHRSRIKARRGPVDD